MSHAATIIGIPGLQIEQVKRSQGIEVPASIVGIDRTFLVTRGHCHNPSAMPISTYD